MVCFALNQDAAGVYTKIGGHAQWIREKVQEFIIKRDRNVGVIAARSLPGPKDSLDIEDDQLPDDDSDENESSRDIADRLEGKRVDPLDRRQLSNGRLKRILFFRAQCRPPSVPICHLNVYQLLVGRVHGKQAEQIHG